MSQITKNSTLPDSSNKQDFYDLVENSTVSGIVNADVSAVAAIVDTKLAQITTASKVSGAAITLLTSVPSGAGALPAVNLPNSIADSHLATIATAGKVSGAALTSLSSTPSGAGVMPIANLASGTPTGLKFVRDDGTLQVPSKTTDYAVGSILLASSDSTLSVSDASYTKRKSIKVPRPGTLRIKFTLTGGSGANQGNGRIYRNGVAVGTERISIASTTTEFSEDIAGWSTQDEVQIYAHNNAGGGADADLTNFRLYADTVSVETVVYNA